MGFPSELAKTITAYTKRKAISIEELERQSGITKGNIRNILNGRSKNPSIYTVQSIATTLGCSTDSLIGTAAKTAFSQNLSQPINPSLMLDCVQRSLKYCDYLNKSPTIEKWMFVVQHIYAFSEEKQLPIADRQFLEWAWETLI